MSFVRIERSDSPLILTIPHGGTDIPAEYEPRFRSAWHARRDADWYMGSLYAGLVDATIVATSISRSIIDCNRDPSGASLYPGQATTQLCPTTDFDGDPLYRDGEEPDDADIADRRVRWFNPYHAAIDTEIARLRALHPAVVVYDCHSIRSIVPRLFDGELPEFNIGTNDAASCAPVLRDTVSHIAAQSGRSHIVDGRFKGGWTTRHYGRPDTGVHAIQMELAMRTYLDEPIAEHTPANWPPPYSPERAAAVRETLRRTLTAALAFVQGQP